MLKHEIEQPLVLKNENRQILLDLCERPKIIKIFGCSDISKSLCSCRKRVIEFHKERTDRLQNKRYVDICTCIYNECEDCLSTFITYKKQPGKLTCRHCNRLFESYSIVATKLELYPEEKEPFLEQNMYEELMTKELEEIRKEFDYYAIKGIEKIAITNYQNYLQCQTKCQEK